MSESEPQTQSAAQARSPGKAAGVGSAVGVLRSSVETPVMGVERRRDARSGVRGGRGRRLRKEISLCDEKSPSLSVGALNPNARVSEVAYEAGFQSLTHFNRVFKQLTGQSPTLYRTKLPSC
jgi:AraC-like DNA-binding protein